jgi:hypothetical protein
MTSQRMLNGCRSFKKDRGPSSAKRRMIAAGTRIATLKADGPRDPLPGRFVLFVGAVGS